ncbi:MAG: DNA repair protein [Ktedonobacteraceae bacterium]
MEIETKKQNGHRERLKARFVSGADSSHSEEALLELLLTYAIPQKDVQPLAERLLTNFGCLERVLSADLSDLSRQEGIKEHTAILVKLIDWIRMHVTHSSGTDNAHLQPVEIVTPTLFPDALLIVEKKPLLNRGSSAPPRTGLFGKALVQETVDMLPLIPDTSSLDEVRAFLKQHLPFSGQTTRERNAQYITRRMFPTGVVDRGLRLFAKTYAGRRELREVCFYRFCKTEPLMYDLIEQLMLPALGAGQIPRSLWREYLNQRFPGYSSTKDCSLASIEALVSGGLAAADRETLHFTYREPTLAAFVFVLHSEFPEPGMFNISRLEQSRGLRAMLWQPESFLPMLYELRNKQIISKISEIDALRQFTTIYTLDQVCEILSQAGM